MEKYSWRKPFFKQVPFLETSPDTRFEPFNCFPDIASKYSTVLKNAAPKFENYSYRRVKKIELDKQNQAQVQIAPNKEYVMYPLDLGFNNFDKTLSREQREYMKKNDTRDKSVLSPDFYTHHDNAIRAQMDLNSAARSCTLTNKNFDKTYPRDQKMY